MILRLVPFLIVLILILVFTAPWWSRWLSAVIVAGGKALDKAGENLSGPKKEE